MIVDYHRPRRRFSLPFAAAAAVLLLVLALIFYMSQQQGEQTNSLSMKVSEYVCRFLFFDFDSYDAEYQNDLIYGMNKFVRKAAHYIGFGTVGFFSFFCVWFLCRGKKNRLGLSICFPVLISLAAGAGDEIHQIFVSGRNPQPIDVLIDLCGGVCGIAVALVLVLAVYGVRYMRSRRRYY